MFNVTMPIPNFPGKYKSRPIVTPQQHVAYFRQQGFIPDFPIPDSVIFCYEGNLLDRITSIESVEQIQGVGGGFYLLTETNNRVAVSGNNGIGAPGVSMVLEILIELGVKRFINVGIAGGLQKLLVLVMSSFVPVPFVTKAFHTATWKILRHPRCHLKT